MMLGTADEKFGHAISAAVGMNAAAPSLVRRLANTSFGVARVTSDREGVTRVAPLPVEPAYIVSLHMRTVRSKRILGSDMFSEVRTVEAGTASIFDMELGFGTEVDGPFDALAFYVPHIALTRLVDERGSGGTQKSATTPLLIRDPVLDHLARCFLPSLAEASFVDDPIVDDLAVALERHLAARLFGSALQLARQKGGLAPWQERRAIEALSSISASERSMPDVALECGLSNSHFGRAFRQSTGLSPHQWLLRHKVSKAKTLLMSAAGSIADIAIACGFSDQSHLNRVFGKFTGVSPGLWRRARKQ